MKIYATRLQSAIRTPNRLSLENMYNLKSENTCWVMGVNTMDMMIDEGILKVSL